MAAMRVPNISPISSDFFILSETQAQAGAKQDELSYPSNRTFGREDMTKATRDLGKEARSSLQNHDKAREVGEVNRIPSKKV